MQQDLTPEVSVLLRLMQLIEAAALVKAGAYKTVVVTAGGCTAKLGMNGKDHVKKGLPILEDCLGRIRSCCI